MKREISYSCLQQIRSLYDFTPHQNCVHNQTLNWYTLDVKSFNRGKNDVIQTKMAFLRHDFNCHPQGESEGKDLIDKKIRQ